MFMCPRSIAGEPFDFVRRFRASLLLHTTCVRSWCNWSASCVAAKQQKNVLISFDMSHWITRTPVHHSLEWYCVCKQVFVHQKIISVAGWFVLVKFWPWRPLFPDFPFWYYHLDCDCARLRKMATQKRKGHRPPQKSELQYRDAGFPQCVPHT